MSNLPRTPVSQPNTQHESILFIPDIELGLPLNQSYREDVAATGALNSIFAPSETIEAANQFSNSPSQQYPQQSTTMTQRFKPLAFSGFVEDPSTRFIIFEHQCNTANVTSEDERWIQAVIGISAHEDTAIKCRDIFASRASSTPYTNLKNNVIKRLEKSAEARLEQIIMARDRGDAKPTEYIRQLKLLAPNDPTGQSLIKRALLKSLPSQLQLVLETISDKQTVDELAMTADKVLEKEPNMVSEISAQTNSTSIQSSANNEATTAQIAALTQEIEALKFKMETNGNNNFTRGTYPNGRGGQNNRNYNLNRANYYNNSSHRTRGSNNQRKYTHDRQGICTYHQKYGKEAKKCITPCKFQTNQSN